MTVPLIQHSNDIPNLNIFYIKINPIFPKDSNINSRTDTDHTVVISFSYVALPIFLMFWQGNLQNVPHSDFLLKIIVEILDFEVA